MLETTILNLFNFSTLIATNASRLKRCADSKIFFFFSVKLNLILLLDHRCVEFGLRRAQGPDGGFSATKYSYLGGFEGTSNVLAGMKLGIPVVGTMAHSFVTSYTSLD